MSHNHDFPGDASDAALRFGALGALVSGSLAAGQSLSEAQRGGKTTQQAVTDTIAAAAKGGVAAAVGGAAAAAIGSHGFSRLASFLAGAAFAAWAMSPATRHMAAAAIARGHTGDLENDDFPPAGNGAEPKTS